MPGAGCCGRSRPPRDRPTPPLSLLGAEPGGVLSQDERTERVSRGHQPRRQRPTTACLQGGQAGVRRDPVEPGAHGATSVVVLLPRPPRSGRSPGPDPRRHDPSRASGSSTPAVPCGTVRLTAKRQSRVTTQTCCMSGGRGLHPQVQGLTPVGTAGRASCTRHAAVAASKCADRAASACDVARRLPTRRRYPQCGWRSHRCMYRRRASRHPPAWSRFHRYEEMVRDGKAALA